MNVFDPEFQGPSKAGTWHLGMTEKQFFDASVKCGDLERSYDSYGLRTETCMGPCGARDWRVLRLGLMAGWERALQCNKCHLWTLVTMPEWKR